MVRRKLTLPGNDPVNVTTERLAQLRAQLKARLRPVLRSDDFAAFDLDRAVELVVTMANATGRRA